MALRYYQQDSISALFDYWQEDDGNPLIDLATGAGKSMVMAEIIMALLKGNKLLGVPGWPDMRIGVITHVKELIEQNHQELVQLWPSAPAGIFSAGLGRRDWRAQILFGGIQTIWNKTDDMGWFDVILVDECHLIPRDSSTSYGKFFDALRAINPDLKIVGLTATPYRLDSGRLDEGEGRMFDRVIYTYGIADGVKDGYLTPLSSKETASEINMKGVGKLGGDYKQGQTAKAADEITQAAVREIVEKGQDRRSWLCFCSGVEHALHVRDEIRLYGIECEAVTKDTPAGERREILEAYKNYELRCITNNSVLTTGFNHKGVDLIAALRPTLSVSLYLQMMGRGTRVLYAPGYPLETAEQRRAAIAAGPKPTCLILDFAKLVDTHGPVDRVAVEEPGSGNGEAPSKTCPRDKEDKGNEERGPIFGCGEKLHASARVCKMCGFEFEFDTGPKIDERAADVPIMSVAEPETREINARQFKVHPAKEGSSKPPSVLCVYIKGRTQIRQWLCPEHKGFAKRQADKYWLDNGGDNPPPDSVTEWLGRQNELAKPTAIVVRPGKDGYWDVISTVTDIEPTAPAAKPKRDRDDGLFMLSKEPRRKEKLSTIMDDDIPF